MTIKPLGKAKDLAHQIQRKKVSALEAVKHAIHRIEKLDSKINAVVVRDFERALKVAKSIDQQKSLSKDLPLLGVPITVKESYNLVGHPTTWGNPASLSNIAKTDAVLVQRLRSAGAIILGKTNVPVNLADWQTFNPIYGTTNNPYDLKKVPGGSSGGAAAALASGMSYLEIGSDIGGSIRGPAHFCGVTGLKATLGLVSGVGHAKPGEFADPDIGAFGPLARNIDDLSLAFDTVLGTDNIRHPRILNSHTEVKNRKLDKKLKNWKVGILFDSKTCPVDQEIQKPLKDLAKRLTNAGVQVVEGGPNFDHEEIHKLFIHLLRAATADGLSEEAFNQLLPLKAAIEKSERASRKRYDYEAWMVKGSTMSHRDWLFANERRARAWQTWNQWFDQFDLLICPPAAFAAFEHNQKGQRWERMIPVNGKPQPSTQTMFWSGLGGMFGMPGLVLPIAQTSQGLPVGAQLYGNHYSEPKLLAFAKLLEEELGCKYQPPEIAI